MFFLRFFYIYRKKQLREIDRRVRYLQKRTAEMQVIEHTPSNQDKVYFGARVTVADENDKETVYRIVGSDEFDVEPTYISVDSPMARALLGKQLDDEVIVKLPEETKKLWIVDIEYPSPHE
jgi:transcription elongation factor GreB